MDRLYAFKIRAVTYRLCIPQTPIPGYARVVGGVTTLPEGKHPPSWNTVFFLYHLSSVWHGMSRYVEAIRIVPAHVDVCCSKPWVSSTVTRPDDPKTRQALRDRSLPVRGLLRPRSTRASSITEAGGIRRRNMTAWSFDRHSTGVWHGRGARGKRISAEVPGASFHDVSSRRATHPSSDSDGHATHMLNTSEAASMKLGVPAGMAARAAEQTGVGRFPRRLH